MVDVSVIQRNKYKVRLKTDRSLLITLKILAIFLTTEGHFELGSIQLNFFLFCFVTHLILAFKRDCSKLGRGR